MSSTHARRPRSETDTAEETGPDTPQPDADSAARAAQVSSEAAAAIDAIDDTLGDTLDDFDEVMQSMLFAPGEVVTPEEWKKRAEVFNTGFIQKGGQ